MLTNPEPVRPSATKMRFSMDAILCDVPNTNVNRKRAHQIRSNPESPVSRGGGQAAEDDSTPMKKKTRLDDEKEEKKSNASF